MGDVEGGAEGRWEGRRGFWWGRALTTHTWRGLNYSVVA